MHQHLTSVSYMCSCVHGGSVCECVGGCTTPVLQGTISVQVFKRNNKFEEGGEMRGCDHQSILLLFLKLRGRGEGEDGWRGEREEEKKREKNGDIAAESEGSE